ncbi:MAG: hypothetical protein AW08_01861 [Candidatus Accumulibacter adjunctus]|uniref:Uncharacterized protein n=1 Tax=Candidatus Accumulibacter adjunctus TaxID=1454001 RepID=A0A011PMP6_9PROT|nr:MAG: hypothetical protein AW08_01861 [Candidatus Accumulibacter adjunctus]
MPPRADRRAANGTVRLETVGGRMGNVKSRTAAIAGKRIVTTSLQATLAGGVELQTNRVRSGSDRRQNDLGRPGKLPERRRQPERRLPELSEATDISFEGFQLLLAELREGTRKKRSAVRG